MESQALTFPSRRSGMPSATDSVLSMGLLHHAAADGDDLPGPRLLRVVQCAHVSENAHLRMLAHGAGVDDDHIRLKFILCEAVAHFGEVSADLLTVGLVLLAAVSVHHGKGPLSVGGDAFKNLCTDGPLLFDFLYINDFSLNRHGGFLLNLPRLSLYILA